jgi:Cu/Ag efflux protein CusF
MKSKLKFIVPVVVLLVLGGVYKFVLAKPAAAAKPKVAGEVYVLPKDFLINLADGKFAKLGVGLIFDDGYKAAPAAAGEAGAQPARPDAAKPDWQGTGVILKMLPPPSDLHATRPVIVLQHDPIPGLMDESMTMPFLAASTALFRGRVAGERVTFGLKDVPDALLVISIEKAPAPR